MSSAVPQIEPLSPQLIDRSSKWAISLGSRRLSGREAVRSYVQTLSADLLEDCVALYVSEDLIIIAPYSVPLNASGLMPSAALIAQGKKLGAAGFLLVEPNSKRTRISDSKLLAETNRLRSISLELDIPLIDYLIIAGDEILSVGGIRKSPTEHLGLEL